ncbi:uncharacterized protein LOC127848447 isoform X2 [Dreissena polymorpha]|uniref:Protein sleepless n=1 Tax=Dreissena polymorpha TaxID=45954 RepID=A0A9D4DPW3_DREPO|nr:uncharacterized protein LOC127848447 isoform X2 [Dreissena polymorpha]KAH3752883.1 hypothetical protein DPMN_187509 [Dreissena polymorpha]
MVGTTTFVLAGVLAVLLCVSSVDAAFKCYECAGTSDSDSCSDEFVKNSDLESEAICEACTKVKTNGMVVRACSEVAYKDDCEEQDGAHACSCDSELCNGSSTLVVSMATMLAATLAVFFAKF